MSDAPVIPQTAVQYKPAEDTRLAQLHAAYADAKAEADAAAERLKAITDGIKAELVASQPEGTARIDLVGEGRPPLRLAYQERWTLDSRKLKAADPETYVRYARKSGSWVLRPLSGGDE